MDSERGEEILKKYLELVKDYPEDHFFCDYKLMCDLMLRESFYRLEKIIEENPVFERIKFLESHIVDNEETLKLKAEELSKLEHNKYIIKPNMSSSHKYAHTFKIIKNDDTIEEHLLEALNFF